jgi:hypothetical protein
VAVATALADATEILTAQEGSLQLRQIQALLEISKEESSMVIVYPSDSFVGQQIASASAGAASQRRDLLVRSQSD